MCSFDTGPSTVKSHSDADNVVYSPGSNSPSPGDGLLDSPPECLYRPWALTFHSSTWGPDTPAGAGSAVKSTYSADAADRVDIDTASDFSLFQGPPPRWHAQVPRLETCLSKPPDDLASPSVADSPRPSTAGASSIDMATVDTIFGTSISRIPSVAFRTPSPRLEAWLSGLPSDGDYYSAGAGSPAKSLRIADSRPIYTSDNSPRAADLPSWVQRVPAHASPVKSMFTDIDSCAIYSSDTSSYQAPIVPHTDFIENVYWAGEDSPIGSISSSIDSIAVYSSDSWYPHKVLLPPDRIFNTKEFASRATGYSPPPSTVDDHEFLLPKTAYVPNEPTHSVSVGPQASSWESFSSAYSDRIPATPHTNTPFIPSIPTATHTYQPTTPSSSPPCPFPPTRPSTPPTNTTTASTTASTTSYSRIHHQHSQTYIHGPFPTHILLALTHLDLPPTTIPHTALLTLASHIQHHPSSASTKTLNAIRTLTAHSTPLVQLDELQHAVSRAIVDAAEIVTQLAEVMVVRAAGGRHTDGLARLVARMDGEVRAVLSHVDFKVAMKTPSSVSVSTETPVEALWQRQTWELEGLLSKWMVFGFVCARVQEMWDWPGEDGVGCRVVAEGAGPRVVVDEAGRALLGLLLERAWREVLVGAVVRWDGRKVEGLVVLEDLGLKSNRNKGGVWARVCGGVLGVLGGLGRLGRFAGKRRCL